MAFSLSGRSAPAGFRHRS